MFKKKKQVSHKQVSHDVYIDTRDLRYEIKISKDTCKPYLHYLNATEEVLNFGTEWASEPLNFQTFRPRLVEVLDAIGDLLTSKGLYVCFNPGLDEDPDRIKECLDRIDGIDVLWCKAPKQRHFFSGSSGLGAIVRCSHNSAALELFDRLEPVYWIDYGIIDNEVIKGVLKTHPEYDILDFMSLEPLMNESDYFIYSVADNTARDCRDDEHLEYCYATIAYGRDAPAALRQLVDRWGIPASLQRPGGPYGPV